MTVKVTTPDNVVLKKKMQETDTVGDLLAFLGEYGFTTKEHKFNVIRSQTHPALNLDLADLDEEMPIVEVNNGPTINIEVGTLLHKKVFVC